MIIIIIGKEDENGLESIIIDQNKMSPYRMRRSQICIYHIIMNLGTRRRKHKKEH